MITAAARQSGWNPMKALVASFVVAFVVIQLAVPMLALGQPRPARFGWQMYTAVSSLPEVRLEAADGTTSTVDLADLLARERADVDVSAALARHLCATTDAAAVLVTSGGEEERVACT